MEIDAKIRRIYFVFICRYLGDKFMTKDLEMN